MIKLYILPLVMLLISGCGITNMSESNVTLSVRVSSLIYHGDDNETNTTVFSIGDALGFNFADSEKTTRYSYGRWDFYDKNLTQERYVENAIFLADVNCSDYSIEENAVAPVMRAPANDLEAHYPYINVNPFTTLLVELNTTPEALDAQYGFPAAYAIAPDYNFDTVSAQYDNALKETIGDNNLSDEICRALKEVLRLQNL